MTGEELGRQERFRLHLSTLPGRKEGPLNTTHPVVLSLSSPNRDFLGLCQGWPGSGVAKQGAGVSMAPGTRR